MGNLWVIARKQFSDLMSSPMVLIVVVIFLYYVVSRVYDFNVVLNGGVPGAKVISWENTGVAAVNYIFFD